MLLASKSQVEDDCEFVSHFDEDQVQQRLEEVPQERRTGADLVIRRPSSLVTPTRFLQGPPVQLDGILGVVSFGCGGRWFFHGAAPVVAGGDRIGSWSSWVAWMPWVFNHSCRSPRESGRGPVGGLSTRRVRNGGRSRGP